MSAPNYNDGKWHGWNGGECPVHPKTLMVAKWACNGVETNEISAAEINPHHWVNAEICAFRVIKEHREPREIWVNEYPCGLLAGHTSKELALDNARRHVVRTSRWLEVPS